MTKHWKPQIESLVAAGSILLAGCGGAGSSLQLSLQEQQELEQLRADNQAVKKLRAENQELGRLRRDHQEIQQLRTQLQELPTLRSENTQLRDRLAKIPGATNSLPTIAQPAEPPPPLQPIQNLVEAFEGAASLLAGQGDPVREEDTPKKGDNILIDQSVIGLLIPEFATNVNSGPYEISGWLAAKGVVMKNYQQLNLVGLTNYTIRRAPPEPPNQPPNPE